MTESRISIRECHIVFELSIIHFHEVIILSVFFAGLRSYFVRTQLAEGVQLLANPIIVFQEGLATLAEHLQQRANQHLFRKREESVLVRQKVLQHLR